jgi:predicted O-linked N-acetylglucosamine transferase (SPINDLY family)
MVIHNVSQITRHTLQVGMKDISNEFQQNYGRVCRGGLDVFESADTIETAQRINSMRLLVLLWINGWTSEASAALLIPRPAPVQMAWLGNPSVAATKLVDFIVSGEHVKSDAHTLLACA